METFKPHNDLEEKLLAMQSGQLDSAAFMNELLLAQLFMPVQDDGSNIQGFQKSSKASPLTIADEEGTEVLILFSSPERAKGFLEGFPDYQGGLLTEFSWILDRVGSNIGIAINPGHEVGIDFEPDMVKQLIHMNAAQSPSSSAQ